MERPYQHDTKDGSAVFDYYDNSVWLIIMTLTTVGYGDVHPHTELGRVVAVITAIWGAILISLIVVSTVKIFDLNSNEK